MILTSTIGKTNHYSFTKGVLSPVNRLTQLFASTINYFTMKPETFTDMALKAWNTQVSRAGKLLSELNDETLLKEIAPGKNRGIYLLGHLIAVNDSMHTLFSASSPRLFAHYDEAFVKNPDKTIVNLPGVAELRKDWERSNESLTALFSGLTAEEWLGKHTAMTEEDFEKDPGRNKLSVLMNRTNHLAYHLGQLVLLK